MEKREANRSDARPIHVGAFVDGLVLSSTNIPQSLSGSASTPAGAEKNIGEVGLEGPPKGTTLKQLRRKLYNYSPIRIFFSARGKGHAVGSVRTYRRSEVCAICARTEKEEDIVPRRIYCRFHVSHAFTIKASYF